MIEVERIKQLLTKLGYQYAESYRDGLLEVWSLTGGLQITRDGSILIATGEQFSDYVDINTMAMTHIINRLFDTGQQFEDKVQLLESYANANFPIVESEK